MMLFPIVILFGGYVSCSPVFFDAHLKTGVGFVLFSQLGIYFFQGLVSSLVHMERKESALFIGISLMGSLAIMIYYNFLGTSVMIFVLLICSIMPAIGHVAHKKIISKIIHKL